MEVQKSDTYVCPHRACYVILWLCSFGLESIAFRKMDLFRSTDAITFSRESHIVDAIFANGCVEGAEL